MQFHLYGKNIIELMGKDCQLQSGFGGYIASMDLQEGSFTLDGKIKIGDSLESILEAWPLLEDRCFEINAPDIDYNMYIDVYPDTLRLMFKNENLVQIHIQRLMD